MALKALYDKLDDIPEPFRELYTEREGKFELTGIEGVKTQADVDRVMQAHENEKKNHKETKEKLALFGELDPEKVQQDLAEVEELKVRVEAAEKGDNKGFDEAKVEEIVERRVALKVAPVERDNKRLTEELATSVAKEGELEGTIKTGKIETEIRKHCDTAKVIPGAVDDIVTIGRGVFEVSEEGHVVTRDGIGVTPGIGVDVYLTDMKEKRAHWWPASQGGGAGGNGLDKIGGGKNPWAEGNWNLTAQGAYVTEHGIEKATQTAGLVNSHVGATGPTLKKAS